MSALSIEPIHAASANDSWGDAIELTAVDVAPAFVQSEPEPDVDADSLRTVAELFIAEENWPEATRVLEQLVDQLDMYEDRFALASHYYTLATIRERAGDHPAALELFLTSYEFDTNHLPTLRGLANAMLRARQWQDARRFFAIILIQHNASLQPEEIVDIHFHLGELAERTDRPERAWEMYKRALEADPDHIPTLRAFVQLAHARGEWEEAFEARENLICLLQGDEVFELLLEQARLCSQRLSDPFRAIDVYSQAKRRRPRDPRVLRALIDLFDETGQTQRKIEVLEQLTDLVSDPLERRDHHVELARAWFELEDTTKVIEHLNRALDDDPSLIEAFQEIERILYEARDWPALAKNYRRMIKRLPKESKARAIIWRSLAALYQKALRSPTSARVAYEALYRVDSAPDIGIKLAELYSLKRETVPQAIAIYQKLIETADDPIAPARKLFELYSGLDQLDRAFCTLGALVLMDAANPAEIEAYDLLLKRTPKAPAGTIVEELWRDRVLHEACRSPIADICIILYRAAPQLFAESQRWLGLKKKEKVEQNSARARLFFFDLCSKLRSVLEIDEVEHYQRSNTSDPPRLHPGSPPVLFAGENHDSFKAMKQATLKWRLARELATARPELAPVCALLPDQLAAAIEAACLLVAPSGSGVELGADPKLVQAWKKDLSRTLNQAALAALEEPVRHCNEARELAFLPQYLRGVEYTATRAAYLVAQDATVVKAWFAESEQQVDRSHLRELMLFALSEDHFILRERLGLTIS